MFILVHEMCHLWQKYHGKPGRARYHNHEWAEMMIKVGLHPTDDGTINGKMTGDGVSHVIIEGGGFDRVCDQLLETIKIAWVDRWTGGTAMFWVHGGRIKQSMFARNAA